MNCFFNSFFFIGSFIAHNDEAPYIGLTSRKYTTMVRFVVLLPFFLFTFLDAEGIRKC